MIRDLLLLLLALLLLGAGTLFCLGCEIQQAHFGFTAP